MLNNVMVAGRLTKDPVIAKTTGGTSYATFSIANERGYGEKKKTNFFDVTVWGTAAEHMEKAGVKKGSHIYVNGTLEHQTYEKDGQKRTAIKIAVGNSGEWEYISSGKKKDDEPSAPTEEVSEDGFVPVPDDEDLPFLGTKSRKTKDRIRDCD